MKKFTLIWSFVALLTLGLAACSSDTTDEPANVVLEASPTALIFSSDSQSDILKITASSKWVLEVRDKWCSTDVTSGTGDHEVRVMVGENTTEGVRETSIIIRSAGAEEVRVKVAQNPFSPGEPIETRPLEWDGVKRADVSYQLLVYSFADSNGDGIGDFNGITQKLDYLDELGVSAIWLSPVHPASSYHGYDVQDYDSLNPDYGTEADFKAMIDAAHQHGIRVYMDYVINHTAVKHPWFEEAVADENSPYRDYYVLSNNPAADIAAGKIPQIATEGANGYDSGQWFAAAAGGFKTQNVKFTLKWSATPTLTIEQVESVENSGEQATDRFLWAGDSGVAMPFYVQDENTYTLSLNLASTWGCLVRTSNTTWDGNTKYGASATNNVLKWGEPLPITANNPVDILLPGMESLMYHSHFWTNWFADLDYGKASECASSPAFKAIVKSAEKWIDMGIDGLRMDGAKHVYHNANSDENPIFWDTFYNAVNDYFHQVNGSDRDLYMVGEVFSGAYEVAPYYRGLPACFEFDFYWRLKDALNGGTGNTFVKDILGYRNRYATYREDYIAATKLTNHDESRARTELGGSIERAKQAGAVLLTASGSPYIYYGEELGYVGDKYNKGDEYVRNPLKWGDNYTTSFMTKLENGMNNVQDVVAQGEEKESILNVYRTFSQLRNLYPALATGEMTPHNLYNENNSGSRSIAAWYRTEGDQRMLVFHNFAGSDASVVIDESVDEIDALVGVLGQVTIERPSKKAVLRLYGNSSAVILLK